MIPVQWDEVAALALGELDRPDGDRDPGPITGIKADSRLVGPGDLFVALNTGVAHVSDAAARGAATLVPDDQEAALAALASLVRSKSEARVVAVVGSTGKTSTKDILGALCNAVDTHDLGGGEPEQRDRTAADRLSARARTRRCWSPRWACGDSGRSPRLCAVARPHVAIVTSIGPEHLELVGTVERVAEANAEAIAALPAGRNRSRAGASGRARAASSSHRHRVPGLRCLRGRGQRSSSGPSRSDRA